MTYRFYMTIVGLLGLVIIFIFMLRVNESELNKYQKAACYLFCIFAALVYMLNLFLGVS